MVMDYLCCDPIDPDSRSDGSLTESTDDGILECDYDTQVTKLYHSIEERQWEEVLYFLETGKWYNLSVFQGMWGEKEDSPSVQARTWVTALDEKGGVRWCQLPLHAAVTFLAPFTVIAKLINVYPKSVRCADDQDMLPLHYAFRFGAEDSVVLHLLEKFPQAIGKKAVKERLPLDLAQYGPRPERGRIIDYYTSNAVRSAKSQLDGEYQKIVADINSEPTDQLKKELALTTNQLSDAHEELAKTKRELARMKKELRSLAVEAPPRLRQVNQIPPSPTSRRKTNTPVDLDEDASEGLRSKALSASSKQSRGRGLFGIRKTK